MLNTPLSFNRTSMVYGPQFLQLSFWNGSKSPKSQFTDLNKSKNTEVHEKNVSHVFFFIVTYYIREYERNWWGSLLRSSDSYRQWLLSVTSHPRVSTGMSFVSLKQIFRIMLPTAISLVNYIYCSWTLFLKNTYKILKEISKMLSEN